MQLPRILTNRYFWSANVFFWLAVHIMFTYVQVQAMLGTEREVSFWHAWVLFSPWFLNWIWVTAAIFVVTRFNDSSDRTLSMKAFSHLGWMLFLLATYWVIASFFRSLIDGDVSGFGTKLWTVITTSAQLDVFIYLATLAVALGIRFYHAAVEERLEVKRLNNALTQEQLKTLRSQLNPHFLFNTLNTIASLVRLKRDKDAVKALSELSLMLRKILENKNNSDIKVKEEIAFINSYLAIQKMRFAEKLETEVHVQQDCLEIEIPNMLLHPLVENAVQHGSQLESNRNLLNLDIRRRDNELTITLTNKVAQNDKHAGFGIGLSNTRARLARLYNHFQLELHPINDDLFETVLAIPIGEQDA